LRISVFASNFPAGILLPPLLVDSQLATQHILLDPNTPSYLNVPVDRRLG